MHVLLLTFTKHKFLFSKSPLTIITAASCQTSNTSSLAQIQLYFLTLETPPVITKRSYVESITIHFYVGYYLKCVSEEFL